MANAPVTIIIPTFNNRQYLEPCLNSILLHTAGNGLFDIVIVNNGDKDSVPDYGKLYEMSNIKVVNAGKNLGWEGGLKEGMKHTDSPFIIFLNDDTYIPVSSMLWVNQMISMFRDEQVAAVGPSSNCVMGCQNIFVETPNVPDLEVNMLIGFCMMVRRSALEKVGGIDDSMPNHGDDLDLSIRFREAGYKLICHKNVFVYHHGFKTGQREFGSEWNSVEMTERTNNWLIRKHGLKTFMKYIFHPIVEKKKVHVPDTEGEICRKYAEGKVLELGCGGIRTVEGSVGVDIIPNGEFIPGLPGVRSSADVCMDINEALPFESDSYDCVIARHLFEHILDPIKVVKDWHRVVKHGGKLILAVPDQTHQNTIPLNFQHVHAYTPESLKNFMENFGWHTESLEDAKNGISFVGVFSKNGVNTVRPGVLE